MNPPVGPPDVGTGVTFVPAPSARRGPFRVPKYFGHLPLLYRIITELGSPLADLAARARRLGPVTAGTVILLTGCRRGVGCTTMAVTLAAAAAAEAPLLLVDGDLDEPRLAPLLDVRASLGWDEALRSGRPYTRALYPLDAAQRLNVLPLKDKVAAPEETAADPDLTDWLTSFRRDYSLIVVDGGSVWESGTLWAPRADVAIVVCDSGRRLADEWARAWDRLEERGTHVLGVIETFAEG